METLCPNTPLWLRNGHADTIFAKFIQRPAPAYRRELLPDSTGRTLLPVICRCRRSRCAFGGFVSRIGGQQPQPLRR